MVSVLDARLTTDAKLERRDKGPIWVGDVALGGRT